MAQHDYTIANQGFPAFRSDLNDALAAIVSNNSGATEPTTMFAHQLWVDTAANPSVLKIRNADNDAWITIGSINQTSDTFTLIADAVGIGTSSPTYDLQVGTYGTDADSTLALASSTSGTGTIRFGDGASGPDANRGLIQYDHSANAMSFNTNANERMRIDSSGNVGIGTNNPQDDLHIVSSQPDIRLEDNLGTSTYARITYTDGRLILSSDAGASVGTTTMEFLLDGTERLRIDASGNVLVATTDTNIGSSTSAGHNLSASGLLASSRAGGEAARFNRYSNDGDIVQFRRDGTTRGVIGVTSNDLVIGTGDAGLRFVDGSDALLPYNPDTYATRDNAISLGLPSTGRFDDAYITNGVTTGSDRNDKQDIEELTDAETRVAVAAKALLRKWRWKDAVAEKGDDARIHFGIIAQDLKAAFEAEGLDAHRYGMFMWNEWWEKERIIPAVEAQEAVYETQTDEEGNETQVLVSEAVEAQPERTVIDTFETEEEAGEGAVRKERMGIRYNELLAFIIAAI